MYIIKKILLMIICIILLNLMSCNIENYDSKNSKYISESLSLDDYKKKLFNEYAKEHIDEYKHNYIDTYIDSVRRSNDYYNISNDTHDTEAKFYYDETIPDECDSDIIFDDVSEYPNVDGSTALIPMMVKIMSKSCGITEEESKKYTVCNKTSGAWKNLAKGNADLLLVGSMPESVKKDIEWREAEYEYREYKCCPIRREGLVFIVNKNNPISSLTQQQLIDIYTGKITNWKELGGENTEIKAFQRDESSGSQTYFKKLLMKDILPTKAETHMYIHDMGGLIDAIASYDNTQDAIGYSVYYYANNMHKNDNLKIIAVDGVIPSNSSISSGEYPLITESLLAIRKDEDINSNTYKLYNYIRSSKGRDAIMDAGYVPVK